MTKKKPRAAMTDAEFEQYVDEGFSKPSPKKRGGAKPWVPSDELIARMEHEGSLPGLSKGAARMNGVLSRIFGGTGAPLTQQSTDFLNSFDAAMREVAKSNGIELRDDE